MAIATPPASGIATTDQAGAITHIPNDKIDGRTDFIYEICYLTGLCANATFTITVTANTSIVDVCVDASFTIVGTEGKDDLGNFDLGLRRRRQHQGR